MPGTGSMSRRLRWAAIGGVVATLISASASAQESFRIVYDVDRSSPDRVKLVGRVFNDSRVDVLDVSVTAEALDGKGRVVASGVSYVSPLIPQRGSAPFSASIPVPAGASRFRVGVTSFRFGMGQQAG